MSDSAELVYIRNLNFRYFNINILENISLTINKNEFIVLVGENGAGKSTLLRILAGKHCLNTYSEFNILNNTTTGICMNGVAYLGNIWKRQVAFAGMTDMSIDKEAGKMMESWQIANIYRRNKLVEVLEIDLKWNMNRISSGQKKRVQIMLGLLKPFRLLIIDEFLNELDVVIKDKLFNYLKNEMISRDCSVIYATHVFDIVSNFATHINFIHNGKLQKKQKINNFVKDSTLFESVRDKILENRQSYHTDNIDKSLFGPQGGWSSGRSQLL